MRQSRLVTLLRRLGLMQIITPLTNRWFWLVKKYSRWRGRDPLEAVYNDRYFRVETEMTVTSAKQVVACLAEAFEPSSVVDVGCGTAVYLREFEERNVAVQGFEGSAAAIESALVDPEKIRQVDLSEPIESSRNYDLVICFEVAEHIQEQHADTVVENIVRLGDTIAFSAAHPGQGGTDHVNEQPAAYWIERFLKHKFHHIEADTRRLRDEFADCDAPWWLTQNLLVFRKQGVKA